jgi:NAD(P)H-flavin reductase
VVSDDANWNGRAGLVHRAVLEDLPSLEGHQAYVCGAPAMVAAARNDFVTQGGLPAEDFFCDAFAPSARITRS